MGHHDPRVDNYVAKSAAFAQPILRCLRESVHSACPEVEESLKWGAPSFGYRGKILCSMAAFKQHASFGFWQGEMVVVAPEGAKSDEDTHRNGMGQFGRLGQLSDLPDPLELAGYLSKAMKLIDDGVPRPSRKGAAHRPPPVVPEDLAVGLKEHPAARTTFERFTPSQQREYIEWITDAKREETRRRRLAQALEWLGEGKPRNWKYMDC